MRRMWKLIAILALLALAACGGPGEEQVRAEDFFPSATGQSFTYTIEVREAEPLAYEETLWPLGGDQVMGYSSRRRFAAAMDGTKKFTLTMTVKGPAAKQGPLQYPKGVELVVVTDELGIYQDAKQVFWAIRGSSDTHDFAAQQVVTYDQFSPSAPTGGGFGMVTDDGFAQQLLFFEQKPGVSIGFGDKPVDTLTYVGVEQSAPGYTSGPILHFRREVKDSDKKESVLDSGFTEDMWFAQGKGLVVLEQKVDGKTSMVWTLANT